MNQILQYKKPIFLLFLFTLFAAHYVVFNQDNSLISDAQGSAEWPLLIDLLITIPLIYWMLFRPTIKQLFVKSSVLFAFGVLVGSFIIPESLKTLWPYLEYLRFIIIGAIVLIEISLVASLIHIVKQATNQTNNLEQVISNFLKAKRLSSRLIELYLLEARIWLYALFSRRKTFEFEGKQHFSYSNHNGNASNQQGFIFIILFELPIVHLILHFAWSPTAAYWISGLTAYGLIFMYADYKATLIRPLSLSQDELIIRYGVWGNTRLPLSKIESVSSHNKPVKRSKTSIRFCQFGPPNVCILLKPDTKLQTAFGFTCKKKVYLGIDNPQLLIKAINDTINQT